MASSSDISKNTVVLDTNALLMPFEFSLNIDSELRGLLGSCEILVPDSMLRELKRSGSKYAKAALELSKRYRIVETKKQGDDGVLDVAITFGAMVVTNDSELRKRLHKKKIRTIHLRSRTHLVLDEV